MITRLLGVVILVTSLAGGWFWIDYRNALNNAAPYGENIVFEVHQGESFKQIAKRLQADGLISSAFWLRIYARLEKTAKHIKVGEFEISPGKNAQEILAILIAGKVKQYSVMFPEGCRFSDMLVALASHPAIIKTIETADAESIMAQIGSEFTHPEGLFFPDTFFFNKGATDFEILNRSYQRMQAILADEWANKGEHIEVKTPYEALILASIVEKETAVVAERPEIAGVFSRRLNRGMRLQTDPTVIYGLGDSYDGNIRSRDLRTDTAYNTYTRHGLPPTPIAMPGRGAIHAALHPAEGATLYFVARGDGSHVFSDTLQQHNHAVNLYQRRSRKSK